MAASEPKGINVWEFLLRVRRDSPILKLVRRVDSSFNASSSREARFLSSYFGCLLFYTHYFWDQSLSASSEGRGILAEPGLLAAVLPFPVAVIMLVISPAIAGVVTSGIRKGSILVHFLVGTLLPAVSYAIAV